MLFSYYHLYLSLSGTWQPLIRIDLPLCYQFVFLWFISTIVL